MKRFIYIIFLLLFTIITVAFVVDKVYTNLHFTKYPRNKTAFLVQNKLPKVNYIFLGSSRVENHINVKLIEERTNKTAVNYGVQGGKMEDYELFLDLIIHNKVEHDLIFLQVDYNFNIEKNTNIVSADAVPFININEPISDNLSNAIENNHFYKKIPFYRYAVNDYKIGIRETFMLLFNKKSKMNFHDGFAGLNGTGTDVKANLPKTIVEKNKSLNRILQKIEDNDLKLILFVAPFCSKTDNIDFIDKMKNKIPNLVDYSRIITEDRYFQNCSHLNIYGANLFTEIIIEDLQL